MAYRKFDTGTWEDKRFEKLNPMERYLFIYLWTNSQCNQSGMYEITLRRMAFETKIPSTDLEPLLKGLAHMVQWWSTDEVVFIPNFLKRQCQNKQFAEGALNIVAENWPDKVQVFVNTNKSILEKYKIKAQKVVEPPLNPPSTSTEAVTEAVTETDTVTDTVTEYKYPNGYSSSEPPESDSDDHPTPQKCPLKKIQEIYNQTLGDILPKCKVTNSIIQKNLQARWREDRARQNLDWWSDFFNTVSESDFLMGRINSDRPFHASFDWLVKPTNMAKVLNGNYRNKVVPIRKEKITRAERNKQAGADFVDEMTRGCSNEQHTGRI